MDDDRWLTYDEVADLRGTSRDGAIRWVQRRKLRRQPGNDGRVRVLVPPDMLAARPSKHTPSTDTPGAPPAIAVFEAALAAVREAKDGEITALRSMIDGLRDTIGRAEDRAGRAEQARDALRDRLTTMQEQLADAHAALQAAESANARAVQAEEGRDAERARADALLAQLATAITDAKAAHDRAWATGEQLAEVERRAAAERERADRAAGGVANERQDFLDAESRTRGDMDALSERLDATQVQLTVRQEVMDAAEAIRKADDTRRALGRWARLRRAWRGE